jgi:Protein of unknown function (DUF2845)
MKRATLALVITAALGMAALPARAPEAADGSFLCENNERVRVGQHLTEVARRCGDPDYASQRVEKHKIKVSTGRHCSCHHQEITEERVIEILVDDWTYDFGVANKARYLRFENGFLSGIASQWIPPPP